MDTSSMDIAHHSSHSQATFVGTHWVAETASPTPDVTVQLAGDQDGHGRVIDLSSGPARFHF